MTFSPLLLLGQRAVAPSVPSRPAENGIIFNNPPLLAQNGEPWTTWLLMGGRGAGKTRAGAEWVRAIVAGTEGR